jgi:hypothetical protein
METQQFCNMIITTGSGKDRIAPGHLSIGVEAVAASSRAL